MSARSFADTFTAGNLVVSVEGCGVEGGTCTSVPNGTGTGAGNSSAGGYGDNQAAPLTLMQFDPTNGTTGLATYVNSLVLPQTTVPGGNFAVSGEYGSSSEATLQLSGNGQYLTIMGYGVNANSFNASPGSYSPNSSNAALGQSGSLSGQSYTAVPRVVALVDASGNVDSTTGLYNVFDQNNPRSAFTANGTGIYVSGQGAGSDSTAGVFYTTRGSSSATPITGLDTTNNTFSQDTRDVQIYNGQLYVSVDTKGGSNSARSFIATLGTGTPTTTVGGPAMLPGYGNTGGTGKYTVTPATGNTVDAPLDAAGLQINLSPEGYFFANATTLYVADSGSGKQTSANSPLGDGGLQKWTYSAATGMWTLDYTISAGLNLVQNSASNSKDTDGTTGLYGLTGEVIGDQVLLYATNFAIGDLDQTYLYGVTDDLSATTLPGGEAFSVVATAPADSNFKGVSFAPTAPVATPEPGSLALLALGASALFFPARRRKSLPSAIS